MKVQLYGSSVLTAVVAKHLLDAGVDVVGYIASNALFPGNMPVPEGELPHDIKLSVQYDRKLPASENTFNLHTGLLPRYGGCNILSHTILNKEKFQGMTFHKINESFDSGEILCSMVYPVLEEDSVRDLYSKMMQTIGPFSLVCMKTIGWKGHEMKPTIYKRADLDSDIQKNHIQEIIDLLCE